MRPAASLATVISAFCAAALLAGCGSPSPAPATSSPPATSATASPGTSSPATASSPAATVPAGWKTFTTSDGTLAFDYPESWTITDPAEEPAEGGIAVDLVSDFGKIMATLRTNMVIDAECTEKLPFMVYDAEPVPALAQGGRRRRCGRTARTGTPV